jgi:hypothetical protein
MYYSNITNITTLYFVNDGATDIPYYELKLDILGTDGKLISTKNYTNLASMANTVSTPVTFTN